MYREMGKHGGKERWRWWGREIERTKQKMK
jgi:hypothetical protein